MVAPVRPPLAKNAGPLRSARRRLAILLNHPTPIAPHHGRALPSWQAALIAAWSLLVTACYLYSLVKSLN